LAFQWLADPNYAPWVGLSLRLVLAHVLPYLLDDGRLLPGVSYTDVDYLVFTDAAKHIQSGRSPYDRHTYRYTPFLASMLAWLRFLSLSPQAGRHIFCVADALCGWIILLLRRSQRRQRQRQHHKPQREVEMRQQTRPKEKEVDDNDDDDGGLWVQLSDSAWWLYNPLAINICTRGSSEALMVLLPVLMTYWIATRHERHPTTTTTTTMRTTTTTTPTTTTTTATTSAQKRMGDGSGCCGNDETGVVVPASTTTAAAAATVWQAFWTGICHGVAIHSKLYPVIYTLSYMAYFATPPRTEEVETVTATAAASAATAAKSTKRTTTNNSFPWTDPSKLFRLAKLWFHRLFLAPPFLPVVFLTSALATFVGLTWLAVSMYGNVALQEGLLYHFSRVDHRHNYSMYWYWIYLAKARMATKDHAAATAANAALLAPTTTTPSSSWSLTTATAAVSTSSFLSSPSLATMGRLLLLPQAFLLAYSSLGLAANPNNQLGLALFVQTYLFVTHNKVITAQ
jgi:GPI mannosyltransferase 1 subunit M